MAALPLTLGKSIYYVGDKLAITILKTMHQAKESTIVLSVACKQLSSRGTSEAVVR